MSILEQVDAALDSYRGMSLEALSIGAEDWDDLCATIQVTPDEFGVIVYRGIEMQRGAVPRGVNLVVSD